MSLEVDIDHVREHFRLTARFSSAPGLTALFGRSGSGKSTLVDIIGGLIRPTRGRVAVDGQVLVDTDRGVFVPKHRRRIGYVFQDSRLFPHLSVRNNLLYGRWFARNGGGASGDLASVVELLGIGALLDRRPDSLSGGEKQRVAIGRALLAHPRLLLMDEPLASLDEARRVEILPYIERLRDEAGVPIVYVSHSVAEVARLATTVVILTDGKVTAVGPVLDILPLADAGDAGAVLDATVARHDEAFQLTVLASAAGELQVPRLAAPVGSPVRAYIRARDVMISLRPPEEISALNVLAGPHRGDRPQLERRAGRRPARLQRRRPDGAPHRQVGAAAGARARPAGIRRHQERLFRAQLGETVYCRRTREVHRGQAKSPQGHAECRDQQGRIRQACPRALLRSRLRSAAGRDRQDHRYGLERLPRLSQEPAHAAAPARAIADPDYELSDRLAAATRRDPRRRAPARRRRRQVAHPADQRLVAQRPDLPGRDVEDLPPRA